jgi:hypothetical protein
MPAPPHGPPDVARPRRTTESTAQEPVIGPSRTPPAGRPPLGYIQVGEPLAGPPEWWAEQLSAFVQDGFDTLVFWPIDPSSRQVALRGEVVPRLRDD